MSTQTHKYRVISLDVWGHGPDEHEQYDCHKNSHGEYECDGYTVNAAYETGRTVDIPDEHEDIGAAWKQHVVEALIDAGELNEKARIELAIEIDGEVEYSIYVNDGKTGMPLLQLEREE